MASIAPPVTQAEPTETAAPETVAPGTGLGERLQRLPASPVWPPPPPRPCRARDSPWPAPATRTTPSTPPQEIRYAPGDVALANTLAATIPGATVAEAEEPTPGTVDLVLGSNFNGIGRSVTTGRSRDRVGRGRGRPHRGRAPPASTDGGAAVPGAESAGTLGGVPPTGPALPADLLTAALRRNAAAPLFTQYDDTTGGTGRALGARRWPTGSPRRRICCGTSSTSVRAAPSPWRCRSTGRRPPCCSRVWSCGATVLDTATEDEGPAQRGRRRPCGTGPAARAGGRACPEEAAELLGLSLHPLGLGMAGYVGLRPRLRHRGARARRLLQPLRKPPDPAGVGLRLGGLELATGRPRRRGGRRVRRPAGHRRRRTGSCSTSASPTRPVPWPGCSRHWPRAPPWSWCAIPVVETLPRARSRANGSRPPLDGGSRASGSWAGA